MNLERKHRRDTGNSLEQRMIGNVIQWNGQLGGTRHFWMRNSIILHQNGFLYRDDLLSRIYKN